MKIKDIELFNISRFRAEHMGVAMIIIMLFHVALPRTDDFYGLRRMGNLGVDIFLFLSGIGLWFSWIKSSARGIKGRFLKEWGGFYWRRLKRIYPAWLLVATLYYVPRNFLDITPMQWMSGKTGSLPIDVLETGIDTFFDILINWDFWLHDEGTFWYIPAIMMLYVFAPPYIELIRRHPIYQWLVVVMVMWCILVQFITPIHNALGHIEIFWSRMPIFFLGINMGEAVRRRQTLDGQSIWMIWILFIMTLGSSIWLEQELHGRFPLFLERMLYIPLTVTTILLLNRIFRRTPQWVNRTFAWIGGISLEAYLIHDQFVLKPIERFTDLSYWPTFLLTATITLPLAWALQKLITIYK